MANFFDSSSSLSSCVNTIRDALSARTPAPSSITTSIVSQSVTVEHDPTLTKEAISLALDDAGFDLVSTPQLEGYRIRRSSSYFGDKLSKKQQKHAAQCLLCQQEGSTAHEASQAANYQSNGNDEKFRTETTLSRIASLDLNENGQGFSVSQGTPAESDGYVTTFSVSGMTCASCVGAVTRAASDIPGVSNVAVNLVGKFATANLESKDLVGPLVEAVEDGGYGCELVSLEAEAPKSAKSPTAKHPSRARQRDSRRPLSATFSVGGMTCAACVGNVTSATSEIKGVSNVSVNLVGKSASATFENRDLLKAFIEAVEDGGYEAELVEVETLGESKDEDRSGPRTVSL